PGAVPAHGVAREAGGPRRGGGGGPHGRRPDGSLVPSGRTAGAGHDPPDSDRDPWSSPRPRDREGPAAHPRAAPRGDRAEPPPRRDPCADPATQRRRIHLGRRTPPSLPGGGGR